MDGKPRIAHTRYFESNDMTLRMFPAMDEREHPNTFMNSPNGDTFTALKPSAFAAPPCGSLA